MLYDPKWEVEVKADPFSLDTLISWLEKQPAKTAYNYSCNGHCLLAQYFTAMGFVGVAMYSDVFEHDGAPDVKLPPHFDDIAVGEPGVSMKLTFGAALWRARKVRIPQESST